MPGIRVVRFLQRFLPFLGYHHILMIVATGGFVMLSIMLAGCSSFSTMTTIYAISFQYRNSSVADDASPTYKALYATLNDFKGSQQLEVRAGYFGLCARREGLIWICGNDASGLKQTLGAGSDPLGLVDIASKVKDDVLFPGLIFMAIVLSFLTVCLLASFPGWHEERDDVTGSEVEVKPFPSRIVSEVALSFSFVASVFSLISAIWQHIGAVGAAAVAESASHGNVKTGIGPIFMILGWLAFTLIIVETIGLLVMILSIRVLDALVD